MKLKTKEKNKFEQFIKSYDQKLDLSSKSFILVYICLFIIFGILIYNLINIQIINGSEFLAASNQNYKYRNTLRAPRGVIYDSNSERLAFNRQAYTVFLDLYSFDNEADGEELAEILQIDKNFIKDKIENSEDFAARVTLKSNLDHDEYLSIINKISKIDGVYATSETVREYVDPNMYAHIIGYLGDAGPEDLNDKVDEFSRIGKTGLESVYDYELRGFDGVEVEEIDIATGETKTYVPTTSKPGDSIYLNINHRWQELAYNALQDKVNATNGQGGAITIMDVETGEVKVMASYPTFNLNTFNDGISQQDFEELLKDPRTPLMERNIGVAIPTGSIFKVFTGLIVLEEGVIDEDTEFFSDGCMELPSKGRLCESFFRKLGSIDIYEAISQSSNIYFCESMMNLHEEKDGINTYINYTNQFGIGEYTGVDLPYESAGSMATPDLKYEIFGEPWYIGDSCNTSIGQGFLSATPMQMSVALASLENGGEILKPHVVDRIETVSGDVVKSFGKEVVREVSISKENIDIIKTAMRQAVEEGTARTLQSTGKDIIAKTGTATAQVTISGKTYTEPHAWVMGIFEKDGRRYAFVVNIAHGGWGSQAVEVAERVIRGI